jgi:TRAP-type C4-dicarboxylate transport system permease small subunit
MFEKSVKLISDVFMYISMTSLSIMMLLGIVDVVARYMFDRPLTGTFEIFEILLPAAVIFGFAYTQWVKGHVRVELFYALFPARLQAVVDIFITIWALILFALIAWKGALQALMHFQTGRLISNIQVPIWIVELFVPIGTMAMCFVLLVDLLQNISRLIKE